MENILSQDQPDEKSYIFQKEILSLREACIYLCISQSHMYKLTSSRKIPHYSPTGKLIYFKKSELEEWVLKHKRQSEEEMLKDSLTFLKRKKGTTHL